jgi:hypothetical protein
MKTSPILAGIYVGLALLALNLAFALGSYTAGKRATYVADACALTWLNGIENSLDSQNLAQARQRTDQAIDLHVRILAELQNRPAWYNLISFTSPTIAEMSSAIADTIVKQTDVAFASKPDRLQPETRAYLAKAIASPR